MITARFSRVLAAFVAITVSLLAVSPLAAQQQITVVTPDGGSVSVAANQSGHQVVFTVQSQSQTSSTRNLYLTCSGQVSCSPVPSYVTFTYSTTVTVTFASLAAGSGTITLQAQGSTSSDQGYFNVTVKPPYGVVVTPDGNTTPTRPANTGGYTAAFTVQNTGSNSNTYTFSCTGTNGVTCGTLPPALPLSSTAPPTTVNMPYSVGAVGTGTLTLTATGTNASDVGSFSVPIVAYGVTVAPDGQNAQSRGAWGGFSESFVVTNTGSTDNTYTFSCAGTGGIACGTPPTSVLLHSAESRTLSMPYSTGAAGTGTLTLTAAGTGSSDQGSFNIPVTRTLSWIDNGIFKIDGEIFLLQETGDTYDTYGRVTQLTDARGSISRFEYGPSNNGAFPTKLTRVRDGITDLVTVIAYDPNGYGYVSSIKDEAGTYRYFTWDGFGRLLQIKNNSQSVVRAFVYDYSRKLGNGWTFQSGSPNSVVDSVYLQHSPTDKAVVSTSYIDGLGRSVQTVVRDGADYHVTATQYDLMGRTWRVWNPYRRQTAGYHAAFAAAATDSAVNYHGTANAKPFVETQYRPDPLGRVSRVIPQYFGTTPTVWTATSYGIDPANRRTIVETADELGKRIQDSTDAFGHVVRRVLGYGTINAISAFTYNVVGERTQTTDPRGLVSTFAVDTRGVQRSRTSPDAGTVNTKYDKAGNVRFTQDANQAVSGKVYFTNYDFAGRPLISGLGAASFTALNADVSESFEATNSNWLVMSRYDSKPTTGPSDFPWNRFSSFIAPLTLWNVNGRLAAVASKSNGAWQVTLFSYDSDGRIATRHVFTEANDGLSVLTAVNMRDSVLWNLKGAPAERRVTVGSSNFNQWYDYNDRGLLTNLSASTGGTKPAADVTDTYRPNGLPHSYVFQGGPVVPLRYTILNQLQTIGDPSSFAYPFSARYTYNANGTVAETEFYNAGSPVTNKRYKYTFGTTYYDDLNRLTGGDFSHWSGAWIVTPNYDLGLIGYDLSGNIRSLQRRNDTGALIDNLTYNIPTNSNRLTELLDGVDGTAEPWDAEDASPAAIGYDPNGNLAKWAGLPYSIDTIIYDPEDLPLSITRSGVTATYRYDGGQQRIGKNDGNGKTEIYLRDGLTALAVFTLNASGAVTSSYFNLVWEDRVIGRQVNPTGPRRYYHLDQLGSIRGVVEGSSIVESYDFEPWGLLMPGRALVGNTKEGFTGKEHDSESGFDYFGARYYMPALGRWAALDPLAESFEAWSPYSYAFDNPVGFNDPTGMAPCSLETPWASECFTPPAGASAKAAQAFEHVWDHFGGKTRQPDVGPMMGYNVTADGQDQDESRPELPPYPVPPILYPECRGTQRCTHWRNQNRILQEQYEEAKADFNDAMMNHPATQMAMGFSGGLKKIGKPGGSSLFRRAGIETTPHFSQRLLQRLPRGVTPRAALDAYNRGRLYYDPRSSRYIRHDPRSRVSVVVTQPTGGRAVTVFEGKASPEWVPVRWRP